jgi:REP element-mobilizing transposase RayT
MWHSERSIVTWMARQARSQLPDGLYHVACRGNRRQVIFTDDGDRRFFYALLARVVRQFQWHLHAYCLLENHYHLVLETAVRDLSAGMQRLNGVYAQCFNSRHGVNGHLFQDRYYAGFIEADGHLLELIRYLALNPVRAGLSSRPENWPWSSYACLIGMGPAEPFLSINPVLRLFSEDAARARRILRRFVADSTDTVR